LSHEGIACVFTKLNRTFYNYNPLIDTLKPQSNGPLCSNTVITLAVDGWAVTFGTARRGLSGLKTARIGIGLNLKQQ